MARCCPLFSGSSGNVTYFGCGSTHLLVDLGVSTKKTVDALKSIDIEPSKISGIFITHEHIDHCRGIKVFTKKFPNVPIFGSSGTIDSLIALDLIAPTTILKEIDKNGLALGDINITPFSTEHDCADSFGYTFNFKDERKASLATDLGYVSSEVKNAIDKSDLVVIESNHDVGMVQNCSYPYITKRRILSNHGHLSNESCADELPSLLDSGATRFILAHLSKDNNYPVLAYQSSLSVLKGYGAKLDTDFSLDVAPADYLGDKTIIF